MASKPVVVVTQEVHPDYPDLVCVRVLVNGIEVVLPYQDADQRRHPGLVPDVTVTDHLGQQPRRVITRERRTGVEHQEQSLAEALKARWHGKASGANPHSKGDVRRAGVFRGECKSTNGQSLSLVTREVLAKVRSECLGLEIPVVDVAFVNKKDNQIEERWVMIPFEHIGRISANAKHTDEERPTAARVAGRTGGRRPQHRPTAGHAAPTTGPVPRDVPRNRRR